MPDTRKKPGDTWENHVEQQIREAMERGDFEQILDDYTKGDRTCLSF